MTNVVLYQEIMCFNSCLMSTKCISQGQPLYIDSHEAVRLQAISKSNKVKSSLVLGKYNVYS